MDKTDIAFAEFLKEETVESSLQKLLKLAFLRGAVHGSELSSAAQDKAITKLLTREIEL